MKSKFVLTAIGTSALCASIVVHDAGFAQSSTTSTESYTYDALGRLVKVVTDGGQANSETRSICYDDAGNRTQYVANTSAGATGCDGAPSGGGSTGDGSTGDGSTGDGSTGGESPPPPPENSPPQPSDDTLATTCGFPATINPLANDTDPDGDTPLSLVSISKSGSGPASASLAAGNVVNVDAGFGAGLTVFNYTIEDARGATAIGQLLVNTTCGGGIGQF